MGMRSRKAEVRELLLGRNKAALTRWADENRTPGRMLISLTYDADELLRYRAIEATGWLAAWQATLELERIRDGLRRLLWLMNDESGGLGWHAPELIGEILVNVPGLIDEYAHLLPSFFHEEPFERGAHHAVYRVATVNGKPFGDTIPLLKQSTIDRDPATRTYAALTLIHLGSANDIDFESLKNDSAALTRYDFDTGELQRTTVGATVAMELDRLRSVIEAT